MEEIIYNQEDIKVLQLGESLDQIIKTINKKLLKAEALKIQAQKSLEPLNKSSIPELKSLGKPTRPIQDVFRAILLLRGDRSDFTWNKALKTMANPVKFINDLKEFDIDLISDSVIEDLEEIIAEPYFNFDQMKYQNQAASFLCSWIFSVFYQYKVLRRVRILTLDKEKIENELETQRKIISISRNMKSRLLIASINNL